MKSPSYLLKFFGFYCLAFCFCLKSYSQNTVSVFVTELNKNLLPFDLNKEGKGSFIIPQGNLREKSIIALGEATHGTKEFNLYRAEVIKDQILHNQVKVIALETDYCFSLVLNNYLVSDKSDSLYKFINNTGLYGIYMTQEIYNMLKWIKTYNLSQSAKDRVQVLGIDMQDPYVITKSILDGLPDLKNIDSTAYSQLKGYNKRAGGDVYQMSKADKENYKNLAGILAAVVKKESKDTLNMLQLVRLFDQTLDLRGSAGMFSNYYRNLDNIRDKYMAENVLWLYKNMPEGKMVLWAHNGHIAHTKLEGSYRLGYYLKNQLGDKYYAVGSAFNEGSVRMFDFKNTRKYIPFHYDSSQKENSVEYVLKSCDKESFFLDLNHIAANVKLKPFLKQHTYIRTIGADYRDNPDKDFRKYPLLECYDGFVFFKKATAAEDITIKN